MKVVLIQPTRIEKGAAGDIVEVAPARARFLIGMKLAEPVMIREQVEAPEKKAAVKKTTTKKTTRTTKK